MPYNAWQWAGMTGVRRRVAMHAERSNRVRQKVLRSLEPTPKVAMKTQGEIEAAMCEGTRCFEQEYMGRGPKEIRAYLIVDMIVVRLQGVLTAAERHLVRSLPTERGRDLLKRARTHLIETARPLMDEMVHAVTGVKLMSLHHNMSTVTREEMVLFTLAEPPALREIKKN